MKKFLIALVVATFSCLFAQVRVGILNGPSCVPIAYMMEDVVSINGERLEFEKCADASSLLPKLIKDEIDVGFLPANVAAKVYNSSKNSILCTAITGEGNIVLITKDNSVTKLSDLVGKTVYVAGEGATPDYMFRYLLNKNGIPSYRDESESYDGVILDYSIPTSQLAAQLLSGKIDYAVVPEPFATVAQLKDSNVNYAINFQSEYKKLTKNSNYPLTVMVVSRKFAENKTDVLNKFLEEYSISYEKTLLNAREAARLCEAHNLGLTANVVANSIPNANYIYVPARDGKDRIYALLQIFLDFEATSVGGKLPDDAFFY